MKYTIMQNNCLNSRNTLRKKSDFRLNFNLTFQAKMTFKNATIL